MADRAHVRYGSFADIKRMTVVVRFAPHSGLARGVSDFRYVPSGPKELSQSPN
ncbi:MAG: hypothetical protein WA863_05020 [Methyloceanibacter sp.]